MTFSCDDIDLTPEDNVSPASNNDSSQDPDEQRNEKKMSICSKMQMFFLDCVKPGWLHRTIIGNAKFTSRSGQLTTEVRHKETNEIVGEYLASPLLGMYETK